MKTEKKQVNLLRAALIAQGLTFASFARKYGYKPRNVRQAVFQHWPPARARKKPRGKLTKQILADLRQYHNPWKGGDCDD